MQDGILSPCGRCTLVKRKSRANMQCGHFTEQSTIEIVKKAFFHRESKNVMIEDLNYNFEKLGLFRSRSVYGSVPQLPPRACFMQLSMVKCDMLE
jgi:hypothetical protein